MNGIIDTGGGLRGAFGSGVLDWCNKNNIKFDYCMGVSAGSGNMASYIADQPGRSLRFYLDYPSRKEYMSLQNKLKKKSFFDMNYIYSVLTNEGGDDPLDYDAFSANPADLKVVSTDADTGLPVYFGKEDFSRNNYYPFKASSNIPILCEAYPHKGHHYYDGALSDPIPFKKAFDDGCEKVVVILSRPRDYVRTGKQDAKLAHMLRFKYPKAANALKYRYKTYNLQMKDLLEHEKNGSALVLAPDNIDGLGTLTKDPAPLQQLYWKGYMEAEKIADFL